MEGNAFYEYFIEDIRKRLFEEDQERILKCLNLINEEQLWYSNNEKVNSIGNLILHLCGNLTQYVCAGIFQEKDTRERDFEFSAHKTHTISEIREKFVATMNMIREKLELITPDKLLNTYNVQGFQENGIAILIHITEHFSYHLGQITYIVKFLNNIDTGYYADLDLNTKST